MKDGFVKSSPHFFRLISRSFWLLVSVLLLLAALVPAPLQTAADPALTPNPVKSAWFLLWVQELVSWSRFMIWPVMLLCAVCFLLPWLPGQVRVHHARWFPPGQRLISICTVIVSAMLLLLTILGLYFRGADWSLVF
ncbi:MAG TPA: selenite/tellurite reduction operon b-type cytochrome membrane protein ExtQ [Geothrix sp.]